MVDVTQLTEIGQGIVLVSAVLIGLGVIGKYLRRAWKAWRAVRARAARGIERIDAIWALAERELSPNGGSSIKDAVGRLERGVQRHDRQLTRINEQLGLPVE